MRHRQLWLTAGLCVMAYCAPGRAAVTQDTFMVRSTGDLLELCTAAPTDPMGTAALNFCHGFGVGVYRVLEEFESARKTHMFCMPETMPTRNEALASFVPWGKANPDQLSVPPQDGIAAFLSKQYPCGRRK
jgi:hypothetical protein